MNTASRLRPLAVFLAVAEHGSFRRAAEDLGISAPLASQIITGLEESLGQQLIYRTTRKISLTDAGETLARTTRPSLEEIEVALQDVMSLSERPRGHLRITAPTVLAQPVFAKFVHGYANEHPELRLDIDLSDDFRDPIDTGHDLAIRIGQAEGADRIRRKLFDTVGIICAGPYATDWTLRDLERNLFVRPPNMPETLTLHRAKDTRKIKPHNQMIANNGALVREVIKLGGYAAFPRFAVRVALETGELIQAVPKWTLGEIEVSALYTARRARLSLARHFVGAMVDFLKPSD